MLGAHNSYFRIVLPEEGDFDDTFWDTNQTWLDIFQDGSNNNIAWTEIFPIANLQYHNAEGTNLGTPSATTQGYFTFNGSSTLSWTAVPELSNLLVGALLAAGMLKRRRGERQIQADRLGPGKAEVGRQCQRCRCG